MFIIVEIIITFIKFLLIFFRKCYIINIVRKTIEYVLSTLLYKNTTF